jgi:hypothetical protein
LGHSVFWKAFAEAFSTPEMAHEWLAKFRLTVQSSC